MPRQHLWVGTSVLGTALSLSAELMTADYYCHRTGGVDGVHADKQLTPKCHSNAIRRHTDCEAIPRCLVPVAVTKLFELEL